MNVLLVSANDANILYEATVLLITDRGTLLLSDSILQGGLSYFLFWRYVGLTAVFIMVSLDPIREVLSHELSRS
jgi:hypothetical protein